MILIIMQQTGDVQLAKALMGAVGHAFEFFLLFTRADIKQTFGEVPCKHGFDSALCILNPQNFEIVVSFSGPRDPRLRHNLHFLSFFNEVGVPTVEVQHGLFQYGINNIDLQRQVGTDPDAGDGLGFDIGYVAKTFLAWGGENGIGYIKSELPVATDLAVRRDYVLVTTNHNWHIFTGQERTQFAIAVVKLAAAYPKTTFLWKPHQAELVHAEASQVQKLVEDYGLPNIVFERVGPAEQLIAQCSAAITTVSTTLLDFELQQKPVLLFRCAPVAHLVSQLKVRTFENAFDLQTGYAELLTNPAEYRVETGVGRLNAERLEQRLREEIGSRQLIPGWLPIALRYLEELRPRGTSAEQELSKLGKEVAKVLDRLGVIHKSLLAFKAKKLAKRLGF